MKRNIFVTTALPYANGSLHVGHIMEYIQADIWVRAMRMSGHTVHFVCADDAHGAPIMLKAEKEGITPRQLVERYSSERAEYLDGFHICFDHWHSTDSTENFALSREIYRALKESGLIEKRSIEQFYDPVKNMFLPDRYIKGSCPICYAEDQYGDSCGECGAVYSPTSLKKPYSSLTHAQPVLRTSDHLFFRLSDSHCVAFLKEWVHGANATSLDRLQPEVLAKTEEWLGKSPQGSKLEDWDISRDAPYFGIEIPNLPDKYFYVWLDAPVGYLAALKSYCNKAGLSFECLISPNSKTEQVHFIGKDIIYFHTLFWPAMLHFANRKTPNAVRVHGFLTVNGKKMSKSHGFGISPIRYLKTGMDPEWLRYYFAAKLNGSLEDIDFNSDDFLSRVNSDLIGKYINIASRSANFITRYFGGSLDYLGDQAQLSAELGLLTESIRKAFEAHEYAGAIRKIMLHAGYINKIFDNAKPWVLAKSINETHDPKRKAMLQDICSRSLAGFKALSVMLTPVLPDLGKRIAQDLFDSEEHFRWSDAAILPYSIKPFKHLMKRIESHSLEKLLSVTNSE